MSSTAEPKVLCLLKEGVWGEDGGTYASGISLAAMPLPVGLCVSGSPTSLFLLGRERVSGFVRLRPHLTRPSASTLHCLLTLGLDWG